MTKQRLLEFGKIGFEIALCGLIVAVIAQNRILLSRLKGQENFSDVTAGAIVSNLAGLSFDGTTERIALPEGRQRLLIIGLSSGCPYCRANQKGWLALARALQQRGDWRVKWVSRDPLDLTREYCRTSGIPSSDILADPPQRTYVQLGLRAVPRMITILPGGKVDRVWTGQLTNDEWKEICSYFGIEMKEWSL